MGFHVHGKCLAKEAAFASGFIDSERGLIPQSQWRRARRLSTNSDVDVSNDSEQSTRIWSASSGQGSGCRLPRLRAPLRTRWGSGGARRTHPQETKRYRFYGHRAWLYQRRLVRPRDLLPGAPPMPAVRAGFCNATH